MDLTTAHYIQLTLAIGFVVIGFVLAYAAPERPIVQLLVLLIPFQLVMSKYGSINTGLALIVFVAFLLNGRISKVPMLPWVSLLLFAYLVSLTSAPRATYPDHVFYLIAVFANIAIFYILFNSVHRSGNVRVFFNMLLWLNIVVDLYCYVQMLVGFESLAFFGVSELSLQQNRWDARLSGPFSAVGITAEYLVLQTYILLYMMFHEVKRNKQIIILAVIVANFAFLIATGNRGGLLVLIIGAVLFYLFFRSDFGAAKIFRRGVVGAVLFATVAVVIVSFTQFNVLFERLAGSEVKEGLPDTRAVIWPLAWERIQEKPFLGHGPRIRLIEEEQRIIPGYSFMPYPHSTYLFIWYTLGVLGLVLFGVVFMVLFLRYVRGRHNRCEDAFLRGVPKLAVLLLILIAIDQLKVSMLRFNLADYQQYIAALLGGLLAATMLAEKGEPGLSPRAEKNDTRRILRRVSGGSN